MRQALIVKSCDIWKANNAFYKCVYCVTEHNIFTLVTIDRECLLRGTH